MNKPELLMPDEGQMKVYAQLDQLSDMRDCAPHRRQSTRRMFNRGEYCRGPLGRRPGQCPVSTTCAERPSREGAQSDAPRITLGTDFNSGMLGANAGHGREPSHRAL